MLGITNRLVQAQHASSPPKHSDSEREKAGRHAEEELEKLLINTGISPCNIFRQLRIPDSFQTQRHEVDIVILTGDGIYCIEVKNLGRELCVCKDENYWEQHKNGDKFTTSVLQHPNPVNSITKKSEILRNHFLRAGICLREKFFVPKVVLMNKTCKVSEAITSNSSVVTQERLPLFLNSFKKSLTAALTDPLIPYFLTGQLSYSQIDQCRSALSQIGTWDTAELSGGRHLVGDYKGCPEISFNRSEVDRIVFKHQRNTIISSIWAVFGYTPTVSATMYKRGGDTWFSRTTVANVILPYNKDIGFLIAGESSISKIPANDIQWIKLSK